MGGGADPDALRTASALLPVLNENRAEMNAFGLQIAGRLAEKQAGRAVGALRDRVAAIYNLPVPASR